MSLTIRPATPDDIPSLNQLIARSARELSVGYYTAPQIDALVRHVFGVDSTLVQDGSYFVVEERGALAGCGGWSRRRTMYGGDQRPIGGAEFLDPDVDAARIRAFFVAPEFVRRGVGRLLLTHSADAAVAAGFNRLELMATLPGVPFYAALGFLPLERLADRLPDDSIVEFVRMTRLSASEAGDST